MRERLQRLLTEEEILAGYIMLRNACLPSSTAVPGTYCPPGASLLKPASTPFSLGARSVFRID